MTGDVARVHYYTGQFLRTQDFTDEQAYHVAAHRRHNIGGHSWGIAVGLDITAGEGGVWVEPGVAVDGYGRDVVLGERRPVPPSSFDQQNTDVLAVWIAYDRVAGEPPEPGYAGCGASDDFYRWIERPRLIVRPFDPYADPRKPGTVPEADWFFDPSRTPPDDPDQDWPVFLGTVRREPNQRYVADASGRPYAGLVGHDIVAPSGHARVQIGEEKGYLFAVHLGGNAPPALAVARPAGAAEETIEIRGHTTVHGNLTVPGRAVAFAAGEERPDDAAFWGVYRTAEATDGTDELRIEMPAAAGGKKHQVVVGSWTPENKFVAALTVDANGTVTVHGDLVVEGRIDEKKIIAAPVPEEVRNLALAGFLSGVGGASVLLDRLYRSPFGDEAQGPLLQGVPEDTVLRAATALVVADQGRLADMARMLAEDPDAAARLRDALGEQPE